jgi:hypothetical protein
MKALKIKLTGIVVDVVTMTKTIEAFFGIENIDQMSGLIKGKENQAHRYINIITDSPETLMIDSIDKSVKKGLNKRGEAHNG